MLVNGIGGGSTWVDIESATYGQGFTNGAPATVRFIDDMGTVHVKWDCGSSLGLIPGEDMWSIIPDEEG